MNTSDEHHIGECITREDGKIAYLKTYRLNRQQCIRIRLLGLLERNMWNIPNAAKEWKLNVNQLRYRMRTADLGYMIR